MQRKLEGAHEVEMRLPQADIDLDLAIEQQRMEEPRHRRRRADRARQGVTRCACPAAEQRLHLVGPSLAFADRLARRLGGGWSS